jgi:hypothetical protein
VEGVGFRMLLERARELAEFHSKNGQALRHVEDLAHLPSKRESVAPRFGAGSPASWSTAAPDSTIVHGEVAQHPSRHVGADGTTGL